MYEIKALIRQDRVNEVIQALHELPSMPGITMSTVRGFGRRRAEEPHTELFGETEMAKLETVVPEGLADQVVAAIAAQGRTGRAGDGKIFVIPVARAVRVRSGESGEAAL